MENHGILFLYFCGNSDVCTQTMNAFVLFYEYIVLMKNGVELDQLASLEASWSVSTLFHKDLVCVYNF